MFLLFNSRLLLRFNSELLGLVLRLSAQIINPRLESLVPRVSVHGGTRIVCGVFHPQIHALALANKCASIRSHINDMLHRNLPNNLIFLLHVVRQEIQLLDAATVRHNIVLDLLIPVTKLDQFLDQIFVDDNELSCQSASTVNIAREWLKTLIESQDLTCACRRHWSYQERIPESIANNCRFQSCPIISVTRRNGPHIELKNAFGRRRSSKGLVCPIGYLVFAQLLIQ